MGSATVRLAQLPARPSVGHNPIFRPKSRRFWGKSLHTAQAAARGQAHILLILLLNVTRASGPCRRSNDLARTVRCKNKPITHGPEARVTGEAAHERLRNEPTEPAKSWPDQKI